MASTPKSLVDGVNLSAVAATYYTVASATRAIIKKATFANDAANTVTVTINLVPSGGSAGYANRILKTKAIPAGETLVAYELENHVMAPGGFISMLASEADKVGVRISGYEVV